MKNWILKACVSLAFIFLNIDVAYSGLPESVLNREKVISDCKKILSDIDILQNEHFKEGSYQVSRNLFDLNQMFDMASVGDVRDGVFRDFAFLRPEDHVLDIGGGEGRIIEQYFKYRAQRHWSLTTHFSRQFRAGMSNVERHAIIERMDSMIPARATVVAVNKPAAWETEVIKNLGENVNRVRFLEGRFIEDIPNEELIVWGRPTLIVDSVGAAAYSPHIDVIIQKYLDLIPLDGRINIYWGKMTPSLDDMAGSCIGSKDNAISRVRLKEGRWVTLIEWLETIPGLKIEAPQDSFCVYGVRIFKTLEKVTVPKLILTRFDYGKPPYREFIEAP